MSVLRASGRMAGLAGGKLRNGVVVLEVALSFVLLIGSGLMFRTFLAIQKVNVGFAPRLRARPGAPLPGIQCARHALRMWVLTILAPLGQEASSAQTESPTAVESRKGAGSEPTGSRPVSLPRS